MSYKRFERHYIPIFFKNVSESKNKEEIKKLNLPCSNGINLFIDWERNMLIQTDDVIEEMFYYRNLNEPYYAFYLWEEVYGDGVRLPSVQEIKMSHMSNENLIKGVIPLLYVYNCKSNNRCPDESKIVALQKLFSQGQEGAGNYFAKQDYKFCLATYYRGHHECDCGEKSTACDYLLPGDKYFTNSLCVHYLEKHYDDISKEELAKLDDLLKN